MPNYLLKAPSYRDGVLYPAGSIVKSVEAIAVPSGSVEVDDEGNPVTGKDGKPVVVKHAKGPGPQPITGPATAAPAPAIDLKPILDLAAAVEAQKAEIAALKAQLDKQSAPKK